MIKQYYEHFMMDDWSIIVNNYLNYIITNLEKNKKILKLNNNTINTLKNIKIANFKKTAETLEDSATRSGLYDIEIEINNVTLWANNIQILYPDEDGYFKHQNRKIYTPWVIFDGYEIEELVKEYEDDEEIQSITDKNLDLNTKLIIPGYYLAILSTIFGNLTEKKTKSSDKNEIRFYLINKLAGKIGVTTYRYYKISKNKFMYKKIPLFFIPDKLNYIEYYSNPRKVVYPSEKVSESMRLPHSSHRGIVDFLETPESEKIGLTLSLVDSDNLQYDINKFQFFNNSDKTNAEDILSFATYQIPFILHSDGARILMGSKNLKQALTLNKAEKPYIKTGKEKENIGVNALIAYGLFEGYNFEDGIVVSESFAKRMETIVRETEKFRVKVTPAKFAENELNQWTYKLKDNITVIYWKVKEGDQVKYGDTLFEVKGEYYNKIRKFNYTGKYTAKINKLPKTPERPFKCFNINDEPSTEIEISIEFEVTKPLEIGDKIMGRHGNKGTIAKILNDNEMPTTYVNGTERTLEMILSPLGIVSRMNLGQLYEVHSSIAQQFSDFQDYVNGVSPFENGYKKKDKILESLQKIGSDNYGRFLVKYKDKNWYLTVGFQYFVRLDHCVRDKIHFTHKASEGIVNKQPLKGKSNNGGQKIGEMEFWCLFSYNNLNIINTFVKDKNIDKNELDKKDSPVDFFYKLMNYFGYIITHDEYMKSKFENEIPNIIDFETDMIMFLSQKLSTKTEYIQNPLFLYSILYNNNFFNGEESEKQLKKIVEDFDEIKLSWKKIEPFIQKRKKYSVKECKNEYPDFYDKFKHYLESNFKNYVNKINNDEESIKKIYDSINELISFISNSKNTGIYKRLLKSIKNLLLSKDGYIRSHMVARRIHNSGRTVITPQPKDNLKYYLGQNIPLDIDSVILPIEFGLEMIKNHSSDQLNLKDIFKALQGDYNKRIEVAKALNKLYYNGNLKEKYVILNRQPSLHRHSMQSFKPLFWQHYTIGLPINICEGLGADFDGDTMAVYYSYNQNEVIKEELEKMLPTNNPFKLGNGSINYSIDQDMVFGYYYKNKENKKNMQKAFSIEIKNIIKNSKNDQIATLINKKIINGYLKDSMETNLTLSIYEIEKYEEENSMKYITQSKCRGNIDQYQQLYNKISDVSEDCFLRGVNLKDYFKVEPNQKGIASRARQTLIDKKLHVAEAGYFTRKLVELLGSIFTADFDDYIETTFTRTILKTLSDTSSKENEDNSKHKFELTEFISRYYKYKGSIYLITEENLEEVTKIFEKEKKITILSPKIIEKNGKFLLSKKYLGNNISTLKEFENSEYIGLSAGHVIGERGTQLSMQTFHTGKKGMNMNTISSKIFDFAFKKDNFENFINSLHTDEALKQFNVLTNIKLNPIYFEILYLFAQLLIEKNIDNVKSYFNDFTLRGPLTVISFENGMKVLKNIELSKIYLETHPRASYAFYEEVKKSDQ